MTTLTATRESLARVWRQIVEAVEAQGPQDITLKPYSDKRSEEQNRHMHALIRDISNQYAHVGRKWPPDSMKRILIDSFKHETKDDPEFAQLWAKVGTIQLVPALGHDGFVMLGEQSRKFPVKLAAGFITWLLAFMAENRIACTDPRYAEAERQAA